MPDGLLPPGLERDKSHALRCIEIPRSVPIEVTGADTDPERLRRVREAVPDTPILVGSGANAKSIGKLLQHADGVIVGSALKSGGVEAPVSAELVREFVARAREAG